MGMMWPDEGTWKGFVCSEHRAGKSVSAIAKELKVSEYKVRGVIVEAWNEDRITSAARRRGLKDVKVVDINA